MGHHRGSSLYAAVGIDMLGVASGPPHRGSPGSGEAMTGPRPGGRLTSGPRCNGSTLGRRRFLSICCSHDDGSHGLGMILADRALRWVDGCPSLPSSTPPSPTPYPHIPMIYCTSRLSATSQCSLGGRALGRRPLNYAMFFLHTLDRGTPTLTPSGPHYCAGVDLVHVLNVLDGPRKCQGNQPVTTRRSSASGDLQTRINLGWFEFTLYAYMGDLRRRIAVRACDQLEPELVDSAYLFPCRGLQVERLR